VQDLQIQIKVTQIRNDFMEEMKNDTPPVQTKNDCLLLDIEIIDDQHRKIFKILDRLVVLRDNKDNTSNLLKVIEDLVDYSCIHFQTEEELMREANSPNIKEHIVQHHFFIDKINEYRIAYNYKNKVLANQMVIFVRKWILSHIIEVDGKYVDSIQKYLNEVGLESKSK